MIDRIEFLFSEALTSLRRNGWMTFAAISTTAVALFLLGGLGVLYVRVSEYAASLQSKFEMTAFLRDGTAFEGIRETAETIRTFEGVGRVVWIPRDRAWEKDRRAMPELTEGLENPYPDALRITLEDLSKAPEISARIEALATISPEGVTYLDREQRLLSEILQLIGWLRFGLGGMLLATSGILIFNAIRLTILARRREIRIMQLVGASHATIRIPFLIEGFIQGALGGALATALLAASFEGVRQAIAGYETLSGLGQLPLGPTLTMLVGAGSLYGAFCSSLAVREPLKIGRGGA